MYLFSIHARPIPDSPHFNKLAGAIVETWVNLPDHESAEARAVEYVSDQLWHVVEIEHALAIRGGQLAGLDKSQSRLYQEALERGVAALWTGWPLDGQAGNVVELRSLNRPS